MSGGLSASNAGPSAMRLYQNAGSENTPPDTGLGMGAALYENDLAARTAYAQPTVPGRTALADQTNQGARQNALAGDYNFGEALPVKYDVPSLHMVQLFIQEMRCPLAPLSHPSQDSEL